MLNSFAYVSNKGELYSIRKTSAYSRYEATEQQDQIVRVIIYAVPAAIILLGVFVTVKRRSLK